FERFRRDDIDHLIRQGLHGIRTLRQRASNARDEYKSVTLEPAKHAGGAPISTARTKERETANWRQNTATAAQLQRMTFPPVKFILPGVVPEGASLLVSRPKLGKSWLVLDLALAIVADRATLGEMRPATGEVLHLALEDGLRRLYHRLTRL